VGYKLTGDRRERPYKIGLNSIYGKLAQHAVDEDRVPPYQCYYAAGLITAITRAQLLHLIYAEGLGDDDIVMLATDAVFSLHPRTWHVTAEGAPERLGWYGAPTVLEEGYFIQPGCWYSADGKVRSRGFGAKSLDYERVKAVYDADGIHGELSFRETRFVGLGTCAGRGNYEDYGQWINDERTLSFYPDRKFPASGYTGHEEAVPLVPYSMIDDYGKAMESEIYVSASFRDTRGYIEHLDELLGVLYAEDQPDISDE